MDSLPLGPWIWEAAGTALPRMAHFPMGQLTGLSQASLVLYSVAYHRREYTF